MNKRFTITGSGIAGLTTAIALKKIGIDTTIFEAAPVIKEAGTGLGLSSNAIKAFQKIGIADEVISCGRIMPGFTIYDKKGKPIIKTDSRSISEKYGPDNFTIHRSTLQQLLLSKINPADIHTNKRVLDFEKKGELIIVKFQDGTTHETDYLVVADGINSAIRTKFLPDSVPRYAGYTCWRAIIDNSKLNLIETSETWGSKGRFGIVPLAGNNIYWFACINAPADDRSMKRFKVKDLQEHFKYFHDPIPAILAETKEENLIWGDINDLKPIHQYVFENIILVGDAAHATTPNLGQGACQAIEDAVILADELKRNTDVKKAFKSFEQRRIKRTHYIINQSRKLGKLAQNENKLFAAIRNFLFRISPAGAGEKQLKKLYEVDF